MFPIKEVSDSELVCGPRNMNEFLPAMKDIPKEFKNINLKNKWTRAQMDWFFYGIMIKKIVPKTGVDVKKAMRHLAAIQGSYEPAHEHKEAGVAFLMSEWFDEFEYTVDKIAKE